MKVMVKDGAFIALFKDGLKKEVFLVFRSDYPIWGITGGAIEESETPEEAVAREAEEETGFKVKIERFVGVYEKHFKDKKDKCYSAHLFVGEIVSGEFKPEFTGCRGKWFSVDSLPLSMTYENKLMIFDCLKYTKENFTKEEPVMQALRNLHLIILHPKATVKFYLNKRKKLLAFFGLFQ
jgi:8-oxo-dGTP diphosphatase